MSTSEDSIKNQIIEREITESIDLFFHDLSIAELRTQQGGGGKEKLTQNDLCYLNIVGAKREAYTVSKLAELIGISKPSVTNKINDLERRGCISKKQDEKDKRIHYIDIEQGENLYFEYCAMQDDMAKDIVAKYTKEEIKAFRNILEYIGKAYLDKSQEDERVGTL